MDTNRCIPANPDISGIGVRTAIYAQNLLCFLPVILYLSDREITVDELAGIQDQSTGMLAIAFAVLIATVSLAVGRKPSVSNYHAAIVLDLSWMNNTSTWIWFILYVHERSRAKYNHVPATWVDWGATLLSPVRTCLRPDGPDPQGSGTASATEGDEGLQRVVTYVWNSLAVQWVRRFCQLILAAPVLTLGSIHLSLMAAIGIWLWRDPAGFGKPIDHCTPMLTIFGLSVSIYSTPLRIFSLTMYTLVLIPGLNLLPPFAFFLFIHISYNYVRKKSVWREVQEGGAPTDTGVHIAFLYIGLFCLVAINILFIVDTELTLQRNLHNQSNEERDWGFGQILALLLLLVPLRDVWIALRNIRKTSEQRLEQAFLAVAQADLPQLVLDASNSTKKIPRFGNFFQQAAYYGSKELVEIFLKEHPAIVAVNTVDGDSDYGTALQAAAAGGHTNVVKLLLETGKADPNVIGGDYGTALCAACANGHVDVVNVLLGQKGIEKNAGSNFGAPLHIAILLDKKSVVEALVMIDAKAADGEWRDSGVNAMDIAILEGRREIHGILAKKGLERFFDRLERRDLDLLFDRDELDLDDLDFIDDTVSERRRDLRRLFDLDFIDDTVSERRRRLLLLDALDALDDRLLEASARLNQLVKRDTVVSSRASLPFGGD